MPLRQLILNVFTASLIAGILIFTVQDGGHRRWIRMVCGFFVLTVLCNSVDWGQFEQLILPADQITQSGDAWVRQGREQAQEQTAKYISDAIEAYILEKAAQQDILLDVSVNLGEDQVPESVILQGEVSLMEKEALSDMISGELGITKEHQQWNGAWSKAD